MKYMRSSTYGRVSIEDIVKIIKKKILKNPNEKYKITIGTDSQNFDKTKIVEVIAFHHVGHGGIFFYDIEYVERIKDLRKKIIFETNKSLELANLFFELLELAFMEDNIDINTFNIHTEIHCDIGPTEKSKTSTLVSEITNWVKAYGYDVHIKPDSYAASSIADKISK